MYFEYIHFSLLPNSYQIHSPSSTSQLGIIFFNLTFNFGGISHMNTLFTLPCHHLTLPLPPTPSPTHDLLFFRCIIIIYTTKYNCISVFWAHLILLLCYMFRADLLGLDNQELVAGEDRFFLSQKPLIACCSSSRSGAL